MEDCCFCGTSGELAFRLLSAVTCQSIVVPSDCTKAELFEAVQEQALLVFRGTFFAPWMLFDSCRAVRASCFSKLAKVNSKSPQAPGKVVVWVSARASQVGVGVCPRPEFPDEFFVVLVDEFPNAPLVLESLVYVTKAGRLLSSHNLYGDLRFGAFCPESLGEISALLAGTCSVLRGLPAGSPGEFLANIADSEREPPFETRAVQFVIFEYQEEGSSEVLIQWGQSGSVDFSGKSLLSVSRLD